MGNCEQSRIKCYERENFRNTIKICDCRDQDMTDIVYIMSVNKNHNINVREV